MSTDDPVVAASCTGCLEVSTTIYPYTSWRVPYIHNAFENAGATISGIETAYRALKKRGRIKGDIKFIAFGGDGGTYDIGLQSLSGALERGHDFIVSGTIDPAAGGAFLLETTGGSIYGGVGAGIVLDDATAYANLLIGDDAGAALTTGDNNIFIGEGAGKITDTSTDNIVIGVKAAELKEDLQSSISYVGGKNLDDLRGTEYYVV